MQARGIEPISADQEKAIAALINEPTVKKAAETLGINECTIYRWLKEPAFIQAYREYLRTVCLTLCAAPASGPYPAQMDGAARARPTTTADQACPLASVRTGACC